jgi:hypothetical protein
MEYTYKYTYTFTSKKSRKKGSNLSGSGPGFRIDPLAGIGITGFFPGFILRD